MSLTFVSIELQLQTKYESIITQPSQTCADKPCLHEGICHDVVPHGLYALLCMLSFSIKISETRRRFYPAKDSKSCRRVHEEPMSIDHSLELRVQLNKDFNAQRILLIAQYFFRG